VSNLTTQYLTTPPLKSLILTHTIKRSSYLRTSIGNTPGLLTELAKLVLDINGYFIGTPVIRLFREVDGEAQLMPMRYYELILMNPKGVVKDE